jgi:tetraacyldisaccharide 4'-kinase
MTTTRALLTPVSWIWALATARRIARGAHRDPGVPVICVGNLTLGGAGKTPVAVAVAGLLTARGQRPHILCRGHGGRSRGPVRVDPARHDAADVGDEALMMALQHEGSAPVWVARDRAAGAMSAADAGAGVIVMDDGHQNPRLAKALSLVVVDGETRDKEWPFGDGAVFPAGPMREPLAGGLARADAVVLLLPADLAAPDPELIFADHAPISEDTLAFLADRALRLGAGLVTSEKDWARLPQAWRDRVISWPVRARFEDEAALWALIQPRLNPDRIRTETA